MNIKLVLLIQSFILAILSGFMAIMLGVSAIYREFDKDFYPFLISIGITLCASGLLYILFRNADRKTIRIRESFGIVTFGWVFAALFGCLPLFFMGRIGDVFLRDLSVFVPVSFTDTFFETISGFTTTGATILSNLDNMPHATLLWRATTHWLGGMGIILLAVAILPALGVGGMQLYKAEVPGPISDKITPRVSQTAKILWGVYLLLTVLEIILLWVGPMNLFDAVCHTFATLATGGFSTYDASVGYFDSAYVDTVITIFMFLAGTNFVLHFRIIRGDLKSYVRDREFLFYISIVIIVIAIMTIDNLGYLGEDAVFDKTTDSLRFSSFQVVSIITTTGFGTHDFEAWSQFAQIIMIFLMFIGGCAGSTGGGMKDLRIFIILKYVYNELFKFIHPKRLRPIRIGSSIIPDDVIPSVIAFVMLYLVIFAVGSIIMSLLCGDFTTGFASVAATLNNIGPGLGKVGPTDNYAGLGVADKWLLSFFMLSGRLELYSVFVLIIPATWRKG